MRSLLSATLRVLLTVVLVILAGCRQEERSTNMAPKDEPKREQAKEENGEQGSISLQAEPLPKPIMSLCKAAEKGLLDQIQSHIYWGCDINELDREGKTPLYWASAAGQPELVQLLLDKGADPDEFSEKAEPPLCAAIRGAGAGIAEVLLLAGAKVQKCGQFSALALAVDQKNVGAIELLLHHPVGTPEEALGTISEAACLALAQNAPELLHAVLGATNGGPTANGLNCFGAAAMELAVRSGSIELVDVLIRHGGSASDGVFTVVEMKANRILEHLLKKGADPNHAAYGISGNAVSPLWWAVRKDNEDGALILLSAGAKPNSLGSLMCLAIGKNMWRLSEGLLPFGPSGLGKKCYDDRCKGALHWYEDGDVVACFIYTGHGGLLLGASNMKSLFNRTHLLAAVEKEDVQLIGHIVDALKITGSEDWFAYSLETIVRSHRIKSLEALFDKGVIDSSSTYHRGRPFVHFAVGTGSEPVVRWLLEHDVADISARFCCRENDGGDCWRELGRCMSSRDLARAIMRDSPSEQRRRIVALLEGQ